VLLGVQLLVLKDVLIAAQEWAEDHCDLELVYGLAG
jgi:hypothetical protein